MADYTFYTGEYQGDSLAAADFPRLASRAQAQLDRYKKQYTVTGDARAESMAVCAMADALFYYETMANFPQNTSIGSVSSSFGTAADTSRKAQAAELYRSAGLYLDIHRGCGGC